MPFPYRKSQQIVVDFKIFLVPVGEVDVGCKNLCSGTSQVHFCEGKFVFGRLSYVSTWKPFGKMVKV
jgi:hypothetical protein